MKDSSGNGQAKKTDRLEKTDKDWKEFKVNTDLKFSYQPKFLNGMSP